MKSFVIFLLFYGAIMFIAAIFAASKEVEVEKCDNEEDYLEDENVTDK